MRKKYPMASMQINECSRHIDKEAIKGKLIDESLLYCRYNLMYVFCF
ncbi:hypothetical protein GCM10011607_39620 [Shewanella inventionis]|uniref:Uncharacterized protein n=1 Tax=Shewanella inventionis TaxID=1738770 RepID=A0ABQ1JQW9_9GAMM|nr:hypothetical protein GCM10011607_39620 [Shewanella inventionis]